MRTAESEDRHEVRAGPDGQLDEPLAALEHEAERVRLRVERFPGAAHDDRDAPPHPLSVRTAARQQVLTGFAGDGGESHR